MSAGDANSQRGAEAAISIRAANVDDLPAILALEQTAQGAAHWSADHYKSRVESQPNAACFQVAERVGGEGAIQICGFLCARIVAGEWEIENVVVAQKLRRHGVGAQLMRSLIERWEDSAGTALMLEARESNAAARALYERHRMREVGRRRDYYRDPVEDAILYILRRAE